MENNIIEQIKQKEKLKFRHKLKKDLLEINIFYLIIFVILSIFSVNNFLELKEYKENTLFSTTEIDKIFLIRKELEKGNKKIFEEVQKTKSERGEIYFYFNFNKTKKNVLEVHALKFKNKKIVGNKYLFDIKVK